MLHESGGNADRSGPFLAPVVRNTATLEDTVRESLHGLTPNESTLGLTTAIPVGTDLNGLEVDDGVATVDLTSEFDDGGGLFSMRARLAQLVYTVTAYDQAITGVRLELDGAPVDVFSSEGLILDDPMTARSSRTFCRASSSNRPDTTSGFFPRSTSVGSPQHSKECSISRLSMRVGAS